MTLNSPVKPPTSSACWVHTPPVSVNTHAVEQKHSPTPPTMAVFPSAESATEKPWDSVQRWEGPQISGVPTSFACWVHAPPDRVYTHAAPASLLSLGPPMIPVFPSPESETEWPCSASPVAPVPTSFGPCWAN